MFITARRLSLGAVAAFYFPFLVACQDDTTPTPASGGMLASGGSPTNTAGSSVAGGAGTSAGTSSAGAATGGAAGGAGAASGGAGSASGGSAGGGGTSAGGTSGGAGGAAGGVGGASGGAGGGGGSGGAACGTITKATDGSYTRTGWKAVYACTGGPVRQRTPTIRVTSTRTLSTVITNRVGRRGFTNRPSRTKAVSR
jgi:hypothetical protein